MGHKRKPTAHQKQIRFLLFFCATIMIIAVVVIILLMGRPVGGFHLGGHNF
jgi:hypothetical protein